MSKIYEKESQLIVRFPKDVAAKLRAYFDASKKTVLEARMNAEQTNTTGQPQNQSSDKNPNAANPKMLPQLSADDSLQQQQSFIAPDPTVQPSQESVPQIILQPRMVKDMQTGANRVTFDVSVDEFKSKGSLIDLACMLETYKTEDTINIFKSNDTRQMIYVHAIDEEEVPHSLASKKVVPDTETGEPVVKFESHHGLTPPTHYIRKRFYRKKPILEKTEVQEVEKIMVKIQKEIANNDKEPFRKKRKYKKRY